MVALVAFGRPPVVIGLLSVALLLKSDGGDCPIGVFPTLLRVTARWLRRATLAPWEQQHPRSYWGGTAG
eukprot:5562333-Prorocentrum_lima.AAC.1